MMLSRLWIKRSDGSQAHGDQTITHPHICAIQSHNVDHILFHSPRLVKRNTLTTEAA